MTPTRAFASMGPVIFVSKSDGATNKKAENICTGVVVEALPNTTFRVECPGDNPDEPRLVLAYLSGKMRLYRIKVLIGDTVDVLLDPYGGEKGRITKRH